MLNVLSLFSGIGAFEKALENLEIPFKLVNYCEIDKYASKSYAAIHGVSEELNLNDVTKVDYLDIDERVDLITYGFPCQDISNAGKQRGFRDAEGNLTRSGLFFEAARIIDDFKPKFAIAENVKALTSKKFTEEFNTVLETLEDIGYNNYYKVLNAKDYGIPQNRERVFIISIRKDVDKGFTFPEPFPLELRLKDMLENEVDESYYLSSSTIDSLISHKVRNEVTGNGFGWKPTTGDSVACTINTKPNSRTGSNYIASKEQDLAEVEKIQGVAIKEATKNGYTEAYPGDSVNCNYLNSKTRRGRVGRGGIANTLTCQDEQAVIEQVGQIYPNSGNPQAGRIYTANGLSPALDTCQGGNRMPKIIEDDIDEFLDS